MKKYLLLVSLITAGIFSNAQKLDDIKKMVILKQYDKAKPDIDKYLSNEKNAAGADGWYYKAFTYNALARNEANTVPQSEELFTGSFEALKKYADLDPKTPLTNEEKNSTLYNVYYGFYDLGVKTYNSKDFPASFECFKKALEVNDYGFSKKLTGPGELKFNAHDTDIIFNLAILANQLKKKDDLIVYYTKIANAGLSDAKYEDAYDELVKKYRIEKNRDMFYKYLDAAKKFYPVDKPYWENQQIQFETSDLENQALLNRYEELTKQLPDNYFVFYNYASEIDRFLTSSEPKTKTPAEYKTQMEELFKKAVAINSTIEANLQLANLYYSRTYDMQDRIDKIRGTKPEELKVKNELIAKMKTTMSDCIPYAEEAVKQLAALTEYKFADKANYKLALEILEHAYKMANNTAKLAEVTAKKAAVEKL